MDVTTVASALGIADKLMKGFGWVREHIKASKDADLKEKINGLYDDFLDLKTKLSELRDENAELQRQLAAHSDKPEIRQVGETNYYFVGDKGPFCQPCYDRSGKLVPLMPPHKYAGGPGRKCEVCGKVFFEANEPAPRIQVRPYTG